MKMDANNTTAMLVGIERYALGKDWDLPYCTDNVLDMRQWLLDCGLAPENIHCFLNPLDVSSIASDIAFKPATQDAIYNFFTQTLVDSSTEQLLIYWAGHAQMTKDEGSQQLFLADSSEASFIGFDTTNLKRYLAKTPALSLRHCSLIFDACASLARRDMTPRLFHINPSAPTTSQQLHFYAAKPRTSTDGSFTKALLQELR